MRLDWYAYFQVFCEHHGPPVTYKGRLLFRDGYMYSATNYSGPEYAPPADPTPLMLAYWTVRERTINNELQKTRRELRELKGAQKLRSVPLQTTVRYFDEDTDSYAARSHPVDLSAIAANISSLEEDLRECRTNLTQLQSTSLTSS